MKRKAYGRDTGLTLRMLFTSGLLGLLYVAFALVLFYVLNAFATGRNPKHAVVAVTTGLWRRLDAREIEGVLAHELSHVANRDVLIMTVASFFAMLAALLTRIGMYAGFFGGFGSRDSNNNHAVPVWLIVTLVSIVVYE